MKPSILATTLGIAAAVAATQSTPVHHFLGEIYPSDTAKREALNLCMLADPKFDRLDGAARYACYEHAFAASGSAALAAASVARAPNQLDFRQAADRRNVPSNDIRVQQQSLGSMR
ncbi:MAG: hypothetical protein JO032_17815 [Alphaproteobacteria bacterium]|nr:hypothetical protein [Alphaproteobacteria bacterium]MBV9554642.1 hypothetical protein [Alphaproteobacteria bacterium]